MARTTQMRLIELMALKQDITRVIEFLGKRGVFQFENQNTAAAPGEEVKSNKDADIFASLQQIRAYLNIKDRENDALECSLPQGKDYADAQSLSDSIDDLKKRDAALADSAKRVKDAY